MILGIYGILGMEKITLTELIQAVGGEWLPEPRHSEMENVSAVPDTESRGSESGILKNNADIRISSIITDSRHIEPGCVFFALTGDRFDGHDYVRSSLEKGAAGCVISRFPPEEDRIEGKFYVVVPDTRRALGDLAHYYRMKFDVKVVGITGSVGKTTCREMVEAVLKRRFRVHATHGNYNNDIGVPLTIFGLSAEDEVLILEMGMNHPGEIHRLSEIASPDIAVITNIGTAHIGILGSREAIFRAKREIFDGLREGGSAVLCGDDDFLPGISREQGLTERFHIYYAGQAQNCSFRTVDASVEISDGEGADRDQTQMRMETVCRILMPETGANPSVPSAASHKSGTGTEPAEGLFARINAAGMHLVYPAVMAAAVGRLLGMRDEEIEAGFTDFQGQRMPCEKYGDIFIFDDTYNASSDSMRSSLEVLACMDRAVPGIRKIAVLGDMLEQGEFSEALHREVGLAAARTGIDTLLTVGPHSVAMADAAREAGLLDVRVFQDLDAAVEDVKACTRPGSVLLFKASHSMELNRLAAVSRAVARVR